MPCCWTPLLLQQFVAGCNSGNYFCFSVSPARAAAGVCFRNDAEEETFVVRSDCRKIVFAVAPRLPFALMSVMRLHSPRACLVMSRSLSYPSTFPSLSSPLSPLSALASSFACRTCTCAMLRYLLSGECYLEDAWDRRLYISLESASFVV